MGKCKKRSLYKTNSSYFMTRETAINNVFKMLQESTKSFKKRTNYKDVLKTISLFGLSAEELSEAGMPYENLRALESVIV